MASGCDQTVFPQQKDLMWRCSHFKSMGKIQCYQLYQSLTLSPKVVYVFFSFFKFQVITAGHCVYNTPLDRLKIRLGEWNVRAQDEPLPHEDFDVEDTEVHPDYNPANFRNDIALVRLAKDVVFKEHIIPVCLPQYRQNFVGKYARVIGWGGT